MARQVRQSGTSLRDLISHRVVFAQVVNMLDGKVPYKEIQEFLEEEKLPISKGTISNLKKKLEEARASNLPLLDIIDGRKKTGINNVVREGKVEGFDKGASTQVTKATTNSPTVSVQDVTPRENQYWSTSQILDKIINLGNATLDSMSFVDLPVLMKALELKDRNHVETTGGLSLEAMKQYQIITEARLKAINDVVMGFIPEDQQELAYQQMDKAEQEVLDNIELSPDGQQLLVALKEKGLDL